MVRKEEQIKANESGSKQLSVFGVKSQEKIAVNQICGIYIGNKNIEMTSKIKTMFFQNISEWIADELYERIRNFKFLSN